MARRKANNETQALAKFDERLAESQRRMQEHADDFGGGKFISVRAGQLMVDGAPVQGNQVAVVVLDSLRENVFYEEDFDSDNPQPPTCYAYSSDEGPMAPHPKAQQAQSAACKGCSQNEFGSADRGRGKACKNRIRLAMLAGGTVTRGDFEAFDDPEHFESDGIYQLSVPPTSGKAWKQYLSGIGSIHPAKLYTLISVLPDQQHQWHLQFSKLDKVPTNLLPAIAGRLDEAGEAISQPYQEPSEEERPAKRGRGKAKGKKSGGAKRTSKKAATESTVRSRKF